MIIASIINKVIIWVTLAEIQVKLDFCRENKFNNISSFCNLQFLLLFVTSVDPLLAC